MYYHCSILVSDRRIKMGNEYKKFSVDTEKLNNKIKELNNKIDNCYLEIEKLKILINYIDCELKKEEAMYEKK